MRIVDSGIISKNKNLGAYKPMILPLENDTWLACQNSGKTVSSSDSFIETLISYNAGKNWENNGSIHKTHSEKYFFVCTVPNTHFLWTILDPNLGLGWN